MRRAPSLLFTCLLCSLLTPDLASAADPTSRTVTLDEVAMERLGVQVRSANAAPRVSRLDQPGIVRVPNDRLRVVVAPVPAVLVRLLVAEGDAARTGDVLAELSGAGVAELEASYRDALGEARVADAELTRARQLAEAGVIAERTLRRAELDQRRAAGALQAARASLQTAGIGEGDLATETLGTGVATLRLRAPQDGIVLRQYADPGERLEVGMPLLELGRLDLLWVEIHVPVDQVRGIEVGAEVRVTAPGASPVLGRVIALGRSIHDADGGLLVRAEITAGVDQLIPGQAVRVDLEREAPSDAISLPREALLSVGGQTAVFVATPRGFVLREVEVLMRGGELAVVRGEVRAGDDVVVQGTVALKALIAADGAAEAP